MFLKFCFIAEGLKSYQSFMSRTYTQDLVQAFAESWISEFMSTQSVGPQFFLKLCLLILQRIYKKNYSCQFRAALLSKLIFPCGTEHKHTPTETSNAT